MQLPEPSPHDPSGSHGDLGEATGIPASPPPPDPLPDVEAQGMLSGKQRARERREAEWLQVALGILLEDGYLGLTMDKLAKATGFAKGTLYLHFKNKEDLICALLRDFQLRRMELFDRVAGLDLPHRARLAAIGLAAEVFILAYPENARIEPVLKTASLRSKASPERLQALQEIELFCFERVLGTVLSAVEAGELVMGEGEAPEQLVMGLWGMHVGLNVLRQTADAMQPGCVPTQSSPLSAMFPIAQRMLDGYGWRPLSSEYDYAALRHSLLREHFAEEVQRAQETSGVQLL